jgi:hypothetical protein
VSVSVLLALTIFFGYRLNDPDELIFVLPQDAIPAVRDPSFSETSPFGANARVIGVALNGDARAYPVAVLNWREIVNDEVGGIPLIVTYCPLCASAVVYERTVGGRVLTFTTSGSLYKNNLVMVDLETGSLWGQIDGEARTGPLTGTRLKTVPSVVTSLAAWRMLHPDTLVLQPPTDVSRDYSVDPYLGYDASDRIQFPSTFDDDRMGPKTLVLGVEVGGAFKAYPFFFLQEDVVVNDVVGGTQIVVTYWQGAAQAFLSDGHVFSLESPATPLMRDETGGLWNMVAGVGPDNATLVHVKALPLYWFSWLEQRPDTEVYRESDLPGYRSSGLGLRLPTVNTILVLLIGLGLVHQIITDRPRGTPWRMTLRDGRWFEHKWSIIWGAAGVTLGSYVIWSARMSFNLLNMQIQTVLGVLLVAAGIAYTLEWIVLRRYFTRRVPRGVVVSQTILDTLDEPTEERGSGLLRRLAHALSQHIASAPESGLGVWIDRFGNLHLGPVGKANRDRAHELQDLISSSIETASSSQQHDGDVDG